MGKLKYLKIPINKLDQMLWQKMSKNEKIVFGSPSNLISFCNKPNLQESKD